MSHRLASAHALTVALVSLASLASLGLLVACETSKAPATSEASSPSVTGAPNAANAGAASGAAPSPAPVAIDPASQAAVGKPAPDFTLKDLDGADVKLSSFKGKTVVLEWFNPGCPFVKASHTKGSLKDAADKHAKSGVVWLAINSGAPGKQGNGAAANREGIAKLAMKYPVLLDESGAVGHAYGATNTPHMFVIDPKGTLVYRGAIDNSPDGEGESPTGGKLVHYVDDAIAAVSAGTPVTTAETKAYGCSVKFASPAH